MSRVFSVRKGLNISLAGRAEKVFAKVEPSDLYALKPPDFHGLVPRLQVKEGADVKAGSVLFTDKNRPDICFTSPVSGKVTSINRGERRIILEVVVKADKDNVYETFRTGDPFTMSREDIVDNLLKSGLWPVLRQRPYNIIANPRDVPKSVFISAFDSAPLAPDYDFIIMGMEEDFQAGINVLSRLTPGKVHININDEYPASTAFSQARYAQVNRFRGPHPSGNVGVQIQRVDPLNKGEIIWVLNVQDVVTIGRLFKTGKYDLSRVVALTGSEVKNPRYYRTTGCSSIHHLVRDNVREGQNRYISGNVLTGTRIASEGFLGYYDSQITVIPEGNHFEFLGWAMPGFNKYSASRTFWSWLLPRREYVVDTNLHGGQRAFVLTGLYEKVFPMDIHPMQLLKAIMAEDIDQMEKLGIYEVAEEDFALCEFVDPSKTEMQALVRKGLDTMIREMS
ncbi:MAG: Na(+)-translocating NADH-quinone reductase subunit A [Bacteroidales bacterium]|nr:Na(+)-translocating NADH-quinone reductase subunit A [Bacteroidales bacterium]